MDTFPAGGGHQRVFGDVPALDIVIVNWNAGRQLRDCLMSIAEHGAGLVASVAVVDNGSTDGSADGLDDMGLPLRLIRNGRNRGFGAACNQGAETGRADYLLFLNPDTRLFQRSLARAYEFLQSPANADVGICGIQMVDETGTVTGSCSRFPSLHGFMLGALGLDRLGFLRRAGHPMREWDHARTQTVDQVIGAFFFMRRHLFATLGGFDERFFVYFEEVDLSLRARRAGWRSVYVADAQVFHAGGGTTRQVKAARLFYSLRSRLKYGFKNFSRPKAWALLYSTALLEFPVRLVFALFQEGLVGCRNTLAGYRMLFNAMPEILASRIGSPNSSLPRVR